MTKYSLIVCGGTFDLFHKGHESFIKDALAQSEGVVVGITGDEYVNEFKNNLGIESFEIRKNTAQDFIRSIGATDRTKIVKINSAYEPYLETSLNYQAIVVTSQTEAAAKEINLKRKQNGIPQLEVIISPMQKAEDGLVISSTRIRNGEINRTGKLFVSPRWKNKMLVLPDNLRPAFQAAWGEVLSSIPQDIEAEKTIVVGDAITLAFNNKKDGQFLSIIDFLIKRERRFKDISELGFRSVDVLRVNNPAGTITFELFEAIAKAFKLNTEQHVILIDGEDDLAVMPVLLIAPLGVSIFYGQPNQGLVRVWVTEENKEKAYQLIESFDKR
jgi:pantetheine-phosphate adenylyltransferase